jgi:hypothetical protein
MSTIHFPGRRKAASRAILSVVALIGFLLVASIASLSDGARIVLTVAGYVAFIFLFSLAVQSWRRGS